MPPLRTVPLSLLVAILPLRQLLPQQASDFMLRGTVLTAETSEPVAYGIVEIRGLSNKLTDQTGHFQITPLRPGGYHLVVRQIGYIPFDSAIAIPATAPVLIRLKRLGVLLSPVTVSGTFECRRPGPPNATVTPALATIFDQLVTNARRMRLLADEFPHTMYVQRTLTDTPLPAGRIKTGTDTLTIRSTDKWQYRPGRIVSRTAYDEDFFGRRVLSPWDDQDLIRLPTLIDFADSSFVATHCFRLVGRDTIRSETLVRIDFRPTIRIKTSDVSGAAYLDSATYMIRYTVVDMTYPGHGVPGLIFLSATSRFREAAPGILVTDWILAKSRGLTNQLTDRDQLFDRSEEQQLLQVSFLRRPPAP
jgi:carboxypeptidase family protein